MLKIIKTCLLIGCFATALTSSAKPVHINIAAGDMLDNSYHIGLKICKYLRDANRNDYPELSCEVKNTSGSIENLQLLKSGSVDAAFVLSNLALDAYQAKGYFAETEQLTEMYQLLRLYDKLFMVMRKATDKIFVFSDIADKNISNGPPLSDSTMMYNELAKYYDFLKEPRDIEIQYENYTQEFCKGNVDAITLMLTNPSNLVNIITAACKTDLVTIEETKLSQLLAENPAFKKAVIHKNTYLGFSQDENTVAVETILVAKGKKYSIIFKNFIEYLYSNEEILNEFKKADPSLFEMRGADFKTQFVLPSIDSQN